MRKLLSLSASLPSMLHTLAESLAPPAPAKPPATGKIKRRAPRNKGHSASAELYALHRQFSAGRTSTLKKTAKLFRLGGYLPALKPADLERHYHPRHLRRGEP